MSLSQSVNLFLNLFLDAYPGTGEEVVLDSKIGAKESSKTEACLEVATVSGA